jgi:hypothetical protein
LDVLTKYEDGKTPKPDWLERLEESEKGKEPKKNPKTNSKPNMQQLVQKERQAERDQQLRKNLRLAEDERRGHVIRLREQIRKRKEENIPSSRGAKNKKGKQVKWKDGLTNKNNRNRKLLEQVFVFIKDSDRLKEWEPENAEGIEELEPVEVEELEPTEIGLVEVEEIRPVEVEEVEPVEIRPVKEEDERREYDEDETPTKNSKS